MNIFISIIGTLNNDAMVYTENGTKEIKVNLLASQEIWGKPYVCEFVLHCDYLQFHPIIKRLEKGVEVSITGRETCAIRALDSKNTTAERNVYVDSIEFVEDLI